MRNFFYAALVVGVTFFAAASVTLAQGSSATIEDTIESQIEAFKADDFATAFTFASPTIQRLFGSADRFGMMVQRGYPMVWRPAEVQFLERDNVGPVSRQKVLIRDRAGQTHVLEYYMIEGPDGWLIDGVTKLPTPDVAV
ncbi:DUF4864 domain-containing protein [Pseudaestuariivita atlantica]|uniref:DUF4864 domain-containing protein n=1 Tax=Pseudaestuariivita atlantica TaxID=1317121 RepID=A0A0L1JR26_9RHOB|nr:DUF4864 domain-containing protein [Pseudaestuariivita atlantica]KNG94191.1 hypothetical protein ATO11_08180 [Pseudaestuariivita atlantica]